MLKDDKRIKYRCDDCDYRYFITQTKKDILDNKKHNDICPKCEKQMVKSGWTKEDIRYSESLNLILSKEKWN